MVAGRQEKKNNCENEQPLQLSGLQVTQTRIHVILHSVSFIFYVTGGVPEMFQMVLFVLLSTDTYWRTQINIETYESVGQYKSGVEACHHRNGYKI